MTDRGGEGERRKEKKGVAIEIVIYPGVSPLTTFFLVLVLVLLFFLYVCVHSGNYSIRRVGKQKQDDDWPQQGVPKWTKV